MSKKLNSSIIGTLLCIVLLILLGWTVISNPREPKAAPYLSDRFTFTMSNNEKIGVGIYINVGVIKDKITKREYLYVTNLKGVAITPLLLKYEPLSDMTPLVKK
jgi:hypothetical protein